jgi:hypothetical protein
VLPYALNGKDGVQGYFTCLVEASDPPRAASFSLYFSASCSDELMEEKSGACCAPAQ